MLLRSGVPILQALDNVNETVNNRVIGDAVEDVKTSVREGESIAKPLGQAQGLPAHGRPDAGGGRGDRRRGHMLDKVAEFYNSEVTATVEP